MEQLVARRAHNPKVARSSRVPATKELKDTLILMARSSRGEDARFSFWKQGFDSPTGYKTALQKFSGFFIQKIKVGISSKIQIECGVEQLVARRAHNPKVARSSRVPATKELKDTLILMARSSRGEDARFSFWKQGFDSPTGYAD